MRTGRTEDRTTRPARCRGPRACPAARRASQTASMRIMTAAALSKAAHSLCWLSGSDKEMAKSDLRISRRRQGSEATTGSRQTAREAIWTKPSVDEAFRLDLGSVLESSFWNNPATHQVGIDAAGQRDSRC